MSAAPFGRNDNKEHKQSKRNFVPNRFDIIDNEIKRKYIYQISIVVTDSIVK